MTVNSKLVELREKLHELYLWIEVTRESVLRGSASREDLKALEAEEVLCRFFISPYEYHEGLSNVSA
jgi:hypothetical protein